MNKKQLRKRWSNHRKVIGNKSPFGFFGLQQDFRGVTLPNFLKRKSFRHIDFSFSDINGTLLVDCEFESCIFDRCDFVEFCDDGCKFVNCTFTNADFRKALFGLNGSRYDGCTFTNCRFQGSSFENPVFFRCGFKEMKVRSVDFGASGFWDCRFGGSLTDLVFRGRIITGSSHKAVQTGLHRIDFSQAVLSWIALTDGCELEEIEFGPDSGVVVVSASVLKDCVDKTLVEVDVDSGIRRLADNYIAACSENRKQEVLITTSRELEEVLGKELGGKIFVRLQNRT